MPMVGRPAVTIEAISPSGRSGTTSVSGPGQCGFAQVRATLVKHTDALRRREIGDVNNQWVEGGSSLGLVDSRDGFGVGRVAGEAVDRLGRDRDRLAGEDQARGLGDRFVAERKDLVFVMLNSFQHP